MGGGRLIYGWIFAVLCLAQPEEDVCPSNNKTKFDLEIAILKTKLQETKRRVAEACKDCKIEPAVVEVLAPRLDDAKKFVQSLKTTGFVILDQHGVDPDLMDRLLKYCRVLGAMPDSNKNATLWFRKKQHNNSKQTRGWTKWYQTDIFSFGPPNYEHINGMNLWPEHISHFQQDISKYHAAMERLEKILLQMIGTGVGLSNPNELITQLGENRGLVTLTHKRKYSNKHELERLTPHTDWGILTILYCPEPGLEILPLGMDKWTSVVSQNHQFVINIGDSLERWLDKGLQSTIHAVNMWKDGTRASVAYFSGHALEERSSRQRETPFLI